MGERWNRRGEVGSRIDLHRQLSRHPSSPPSRLSKPSLPPPPPPPHHHHFQKWSGISLTDPATTHCCRLWNPATEVEPGVQRRNDRQNGSSLNGTAGLHKKDHLACLFRSALVLVFRCLLAGSKRDQDRICNFWKREIGQVGWFL